MADETTRVEIGIGIGQVLSVKLTEKELGALRKAVESGERLARHEGRRGQRCDQRRNGRLPPRRRRLAHDRLLELVPRKLALIAIAATIAAALWWRRNPSACPYNQRFWVQAPHPLITRDRLREVLGPEPGERLLEIGPGTGYYSLDLASWIGPEGTLEIFDIQQDMLDHTMRRAGEAGLGNVVATQGDAQELPYEDDSVDAVILTTVLGEIPDQRRAVAEAARVLRPGGRLVVGELIGDPHYVSLGSLRGHGEGSGLRFEERSGSALGYFARLRA